MGDDDACLCDVALHLLIGDEALPFAILGFIGAESDLHEDVILDDAVSLEFVHAPYQSVERLLVGAYGNKDHVCGPLEDAAQVDGLGVDLGLLLPLYNEGVGNGVNHASGQGRLVDAVKDLDVDEFGTEELADVEERDGDGGAAADDEVRAFSAEDLEGEYGVDEQGLDAAVGWVVAEFYLFVPEEAPCVLLVKGDPESVHVLPEGLEHIHLYEVSAGGSDEAEFVMSLLWIIHWS